MNSILKRAKVYLVFYRSTLKISIPISILATFIILFRNSEWSITTMINLFLFMNATAGLAIDVGYKELARKDEYYFYYNIGISKLRLILGCLMFSFSAYFLFNLIIRICKILLK